MARAASCLYSRWMRNVRHPFSGSCTILHYTAPNRTTLHCNTLDCTAQICLSYCSVLPDEAVHCTVCTSFNIYGLDSNAVQCNFSALNYKASQCPNCFRSHFAVQCSVAHCTVLQRSLQRARWRIMEKLSFCSGCRQCSLHGVT